jgi:hypothetical protein
LHTSWRINASIPGRLASRRPRAMEASAFGVKIIAEHEPDHRRRSRKWGKCRLCGGLFRRRLLPAQAVRGPFWEENNTE